MCVFADPSPEVKRAAEDLRVEERGERGSIRPSSSNNAVSTDAVSTDLIQGDRAYRSWQLTMTGLQYLGKYIAYIQPLSFSLDCFGF